MEEVALYRKYRPGNFDNLVGQDHVKQTLINAVKSSHIAHAYIFTGPRGTGKTSTARLIAKAINCSDLQNEYEPCDKCDFCKDITDGRLIDLIEIDAASNRGIDEVRDLNEKIKFAPSRAKCKVYIIDEVHMMTKEAFNALLKTLEEPPSHAHFILATTEIHKIPATIISRCQRFDFRRLSEKAIMTRLNYIAQIEKFDVEDKALEAISRYVDGGMRDAIGLLEQLLVDGKLSLNNVQEVLRISDHSLLDSLLDALRKKNAKDAIAIVHELHDQGSDLKQFMHEFIDRLRQVLLSAISKGESAKVPMLIKIIEVFQEAYSRINSSAVPQLPLEIAIIKIAGNIKDVPADMDEPVEVEKQKSVEKKPVKTVVKKKEVSKKVETKGEDQVDESFEVTLDLLKNKWPRITERIKTPSLKMSIRNAIPAKIQNSDLTIQFSTNFHRDKVMEHDHRVELESIIKELFKKEVKIISVVKEFDIKPVMEEEGGSDTVGDALEIFGGEVME